MPPSPMNTHHVATQTPQQAFYGQFWAHENRTPRDAGLTCRHRMQPRRVTEDEEAVRPLITNDAVAGAMYMLSRLSRQQKTPSAVVSGE